MTKKEEQKKEEETKRSVIKMEFNPQIAKEIGVEEAIMYSNIEFWVLKNEANKKHFHDNYYWTYNSYDAFEKLFWFWTPKQIRRIIRNLEENGYIKTGNYNKTKYDRTKWYTTICPNGKMEKTEQENEEDQVGRPIPDNKPNNNKPDSFGEQTEKPLEEKTNKQLIEEFLELKDTEENKIILNNLYEEHDKEFIDDEVKSFCNYWTERTLSGKKQKWELEKTFEIEKRLSYWLRNSNKYSSSKNNNKDKKEIYNLL